MVSPRVVLARLLDKWARRCARLSERLERAATQQYRRHSRMQAIKAARQCERGRTLRDAAAVEILLAEIAHEARADR
jgi:hypothetical protein